MTATQILWINLVLAVTLGLVLAFEPGEPGTMERRPRDANAPLLSPFLLWRVVLVSMLLAALSLGVFFHTLGQRSEEHTSELQSLMRISYAVFCLKKKNNKRNKHKKPINAIHSTTLPSQHSTTKRVCNN